jgi:hypothetical protein
MAATEVRAATVAAEAAVTAGAGGAEAVAALQAALQGAAAGLPAYELRQAMEARPAPARSD